MTHLAAYPTVFVSYAKEDRIAARRLYSRLQEADLDPWMDTEDLAPGQRWKDVIRQVIRNSRFFV